MKASLVKAAALAVVMIALVGGCSKTKAAVPTGQQQENKQQAQATESLVNNQALPHFNYSQYRQNLIELETAMAKGVQTTSFFFNQGVQDPMGQCPSIGVPIPNTASLSNPQQVVDTYGGYQARNSSVVGQMDPYGVYVPTSSTGTYVMCINALGQVTPKYWEGFVEADFGPAKWNTTTHAVELIGPPSFTFTKSK